MNLRGLFPCMKDETRGAGGVAVSGQAAYFVAKHSLIGLSKVAALEYAQSKIPGITESLMMQRFSGDAADGGRG